MTSGASRGAARAVAIDRRDASGRQADRLPAGREVPADHFGVLIYFGFAAERATARAVAMPFIPRNRVDDATLEQCAAFGPPDVLRDRLEAYVRGGASKFILRPMVPADQMLDQLARLADEVVPSFHAR